MPNATKLLDTLLQLQSYSSLFLWLLGIISSFISGVYITKLLKWWHCRCVHRVLELHNHDCNIVMPIRTDCISDNNPNYRFNAVTEGEAKQLIPLMQIISNTDRQSSRKVSLLSPNEANFSNAGAWFLLGGPFSNEAVLKLFGQNGNLGFHFRERPILFSSASLGKREIARAQEAQILSARDDFTLEYCSNIFTFTKDSGYILLLKLKQTSDRGVVHVVGGFTLANTVNALNALQSQQLYKHLKKTRHLQQYFLILRCDANGSPLMTDEGIIDITDIAFQ